MIPRIDRRLRLGLVLLMTSVSGGPLGCNDTTAESGSMAHATPASDDAQDDHSSHEDDAHLHEEDEHEAEAIALSTEQMRAAGIESATAGPGLIDSGIELLGEVRPNGERIAHIVPRFAGVVQATRRSVGDAVKRGDVLAIIESSESLVPYEVKTLIDGVVLERHLTLGEGVGVDDAVFVVADLSTVWIDLSVYPQDLAATRVGQDVLISAGDSGPTARGTIFYVTPSMDPQTRTATARVELANPDRAWRPGLFVSARVLDPTPADVAIPKSAVQIIEGTPHVFVQQEGVFSARPVTLGREGDTLVQVLRGLRAGEAIVVRNAFLLKAELGKGEAEHAH